MWSVRCLLFMGQTSSIHTILEVCKFRFLPVYQLRLPCFFTYRHKNSNRFKTNLHWLYLEYQRNPKYKLILEMCKIWFWQFCDCGWHIFPRKNANFGRFEVAFDRPEFDRTQVLVLCIICFIHCRSLATMFIVSVCFMLYSNVKLRSNNFLQKN